MGCSLTHDVFICHSSKDADIAEAVCTTLEERGVHCWIAPRNILPGDVWAAAISRAIQSSRVLILVYTHSARESDQVLREVERAAAAKIAILPIKIGQVEPSDAMDYYLGASHWFVAHAPPLESELERLAQDVTALLSDQSLPRRGPPRASRSRTSWLVGALLLVAFALVFTRPWEALRPGGNAEGPPDTEVSSGGEPGIRILEPREADVLPSRTVTVRGELSGDVGVERLAVNGTEVELRDGVFAETLTVYEEGGFEIAVSAVLEGVERPLESRRRVVIDTQAPIIKISSTSPTSTTQVAVIQGRVVEANLRELTADGEPVAVDREFFEWPVVLTEGAPTLVRLRAVDRADHASREVEVRLEYAPPEPSPDATLEWLADYEDALRLARKRECLVFFVATLPDW